MKTTEEWAAEPIFQQNYNAATDTQIKVFREIQLDAFKAGAEWAARIVAKENWKAGCPGKIDGSVWFIAKLDNGDRVVLKSLPEDFSYDYTTADDTYYLAKRITSWMPFWDGPYKNPLEQAILTTAEQLTEIPR